MNSLKFNKKIISSINLLKYAELKIFCKCVDVYKLHEGDDKDKKYEFLSKLKKIKFKKIPIEKYKDMNENTDFEQDYWSRHLEVFTKLVIFLLN